MNRAFAMKKFASLALALPLALAPALAAAQSMQEQLATEPCVVSIAHGRNLSRERPALNDRWNTINASIQKFMDDRLRERQVKVFSELYLVETTDAQLKLQGTLRLAGEHQCTVLLQFSAYAAKANELTTEVLVSRLEYRRNAEDTATVITVGATLYERQRKYDTSGDFTRNFILRDTGVEYANHLLAAPAKP